MSEDRATTMSETEFRRYCWDTEHRYCIRAEERDEDYVVLTVECVEHGTVRP